MKLLADRTIVRSPTLGLTAICLGFLMITLDATIVNVALGPIGTDLGGAVSTAQWIVNGYTLAFAALLLSAGALADRLGLRTGFLVGLAVFALGSAACACATSLAALIVARVVQGAGAAALMPCSLALIAHMFPDSGDRRRALALWGGASGIGLAAGPVLGGILTAGFGWRAIFLVNVPIAAAAAELLRRHVKETPRHRHPLDLPGQIIATAGLATLTGGFIVAGSSIFLFAFYTITSGGFPWYSAYASTKLSAICALWAVIPWLTLVGGLFALVLSARRHDPDLRFVSLTPIERQED